MLKSDVQKNWHDIFEVGVLIKGLNGLWGTISGFFILFLSEATLNHWFFRATHGELLEDPNDKLINFLAHAMKDFTADTKIFVAIYMLIHGLLNIFLAIQLRRDRHWAYIVTICATLLFMIYQVYRISLHHSLFLTFITIYDALFIILAWHEYERCRYKSTLTTSIS
jgi:uncharacterized membrane protein